MADDRLIPASINDLSAQAYNEMAERLGSLDVTVLLVYIIDYVPASVLPHLAEQFHVAENEGWLLCNADDERRALIKSAIELHRYKGTPYAIEMVLDVLGLSGELQEWFQYSGEPYHFRVAIDISKKGLDEAFINKIEMLINKWKNARSHLDSLRLYCSTTGHQRVACSTMAGECITVYPYNPPALTAAVISRSIGAVFAVETVEIRPQ